MAWRLQCPRKMISAKSVQSLGKALLTFVLASSLALLDRVEAHCASTLCTFSSDSCACTFSSDSVQDFIAGNAEKIVEGGSMTAAEVVAALSAAVLDLESALAAAHYQVQIAECKLMGDGAVTTRGGWCQLSRRSSLSVQNKVSPSLADFLTRNVFTGKTVGDFGAGNGFYSQVFNQSGLVRARAFDGMIGAELATDGLVEYLDLGAPVRVTDKVPMFDFVLSLEVGEHIPRNSEGVFLDNLCRHAKEGIVLSWAVKGQGGHGHVNEQDNDYIIDQMERRGFRIDVALSNLMRTSLPLARDGTWWLMHTLMVFWREQ